MTENPIWQKYHVCIWTDKGNFDAVRQMLREKHGLIDPIDDLIKWSQTPGRKLVYVDRETGQGIYRVDFREKTDHRLAAHWPNSLISFGYWNLNERPPRIKQQDPMKAALVDAYNMLKPNHVTLGSEVGEHIELSDLLGINPSCATD